MAQTIKYSTRVLLDIPQFPSANEVFAIGDVVRSYRSAFTNEKPYKNEFIQGVVIGMQSCIKPNDYLLVKWYLKFSFGSIYPFSLPDGRNTFEISVRSPHLVKLNQGQLALPI